MHVYLQWRYFTWNWLHEGILLRHGFRNRYDFLVLIMLYFTICTESIKRKSNHWHVSVLTLLFSGVSLVPSPLLFSLVPSPLLILPLRSLARRLILISSQTLSIHPSVSQTRSDNFFPASFPSSFPSSFPDLPSFLPSFLPLVWVGCARSRTCPGPCGFCLLWWYYLIIY